MPVTVTFDVAMDASSSPMKMKVTDTSDYASAGIDIQNVTGILVVTHPNNNRYVGDLNNPDITYDANTGTLTVGEVSLIRAADGLPIEGTYSVELITYDNGVEAGRLTRTFSFQYDRITPQVTESFDVFTPQLLVNNTTASYAIPGYTETVTATLSATSPQIAINASTISNQLDLVFNGDYYDAQYDIQLAVDVTYQSDTYSWLSIIDRIVVTRELHAYTPRTLADLLSAINTFKNDANTFKGVNSTLYQRRTEDYEQLLSLYEHLRRRVEAALFGDDLYDIVEQIEQILRLNTEYTPIHTGQPIPPYTVGIVSGGSGNVQAQEFQFVGDGTTTVFTATHNLFSNLGVTINAPLVSVFFVTTGQEREMQLAPARRATPDTLEVEITPAPANGEVFYVRVG